MIRRKCVKAAPLRILFVVPWLVACHGGEYKLASSASRPFLEDPQAIPGSREFATTFAYGDFILHTPEGDHTIRCEGIPGVSGVAAATAFEKTESGQPHLPLRRLITHFHFDEPSIVIEQNPNRDSTGVLLGNRVGGTSSLFPGKATFYQYIYLNLEGRVLANREPLVMSAEDVKRWPPIGSVFKSEGPTDFYDLEQLDNPEAPIVATLAACNAVPHTRIGFPGEAPSLP